MGRGDGWEGGRENPKKPKKRFAYDGRHIQLVTRLPTKSRQLNSTPQNQPQPTLQHRVDVASCLSDGVRAGGAREAQAQAAQAVRQAAVRQAAG